MKIADKVERAKQAIQFITDHDDAPIEEVVAATDELKTFIASELKAAPKRRAARAKAKAPKAQA
jgi:hypothetical protein